MHTPDTEPGSLADRAAQRMAIYLDDDGMARMAMVDLHDVCDANMLVEAAAQDELMVSAVTPPDAAEELAYYNAVAELYDTHYRDDAPEPVRPIADNIRYVR